MVVVVVVKLRAILALVYAGVLCGLAQDARVFAILWFQEAIADLGREGGLG